MDTHVKVVAVLFLVLGGLGVLAALGLMALFGGAAGIVGMGAESEEAAVAIPIIGITGAMLTAFLLVLSLPGVIAGFGLLAYKPWARILGIVLAAINLINIPIGTIFGAYALWALLHKDSERLFAAGPQVITHS